MGTIFPVEPLRADLNFKTFLYWTSLNVKMNCFKFNSVTMNSEHMLKLLNYLLFLYKLPHWRPAASFLLAAIIHSYYWGRWVSLNVSNQLVIHFRLASSLKNKIPSVTEMGKKVKSQWLMTASDHSQLQQMGMMTYAGQTL